LRQLRRHYVDQLYDGRGALLRSAANSVSVSFASKIFSTPRMRGGLPRANAVKYVHEKHGVNLLTCICAIDKATLPTLLEYWVPGVEVAGIHELVGNALVMRGEKERTTDLRGEPIAVEEAAHA
jgi:hypothetical protein